MAVGFLGPGLKVGFRLWALGFRGLGFRGLGFRLKVFGGLGGLEFSF